MLLTIQPQWALLAGILSCDPAGGTERRVVKDGYHFCFGAQWNGYSRFMQDGVEVRRYATRIVPGKPHRVVCAQNGRTLTHAVDGREHLTQW